MIQQYHKGTFYNTNTSYYIAGSLTNNTIKELHFTRKLQPFFAIYDEINSKQYIIPITLKEAIDFFTSKKIHILPAGKSLMEQIVTLIIQQVQTPGPSQ